MKKSGFTLAETLITIGIIGILAVITAPMLEKLSMDKVNAARLISTVQTIESALTMAIDQENADDIFGTSMYKNNIPLKSKTLPTQAQIDKFMGNLKQYLAVSSYKRQTMNQYYSDKNVSKIYLMNNLTGDKGKVWSANDNTKNAFPIELKSGVVVFWKIYGYDNSQTFNRKDVVMPEGGALWVRAGDIYIDINGAKEPNTLGRDIFSFNLGQDGILYPRGGLDCSLFHSYGESKDSVWTNANTSNLYSCSNGIYGTANDAGSGCTARVLQTGKIDY